MEFQDVIRARHSVRDFRSDPVPREVLQNLVGAAAMAPSSMNEQPWSFYVLSGESRHRLGKIIAQTTIHLAEYMDVLGPKRYEESVEWYSSLGNAPTLIAVVAPISRDALEMLNRHLSVGAAVENLLLAAVDQGLAACNITYSHWVEDEIAELLQLPGAHVVLTVIAVGYAGAVPPAAPRHETDVAIWMD
jgi:nitroreductase